MNFLRISIASAVVLAFGGPTRAQSFNCDLDEFGGTEQTGNGVPSSAFGAAANQPGVWNRIFASGTTTPVNLTGLDGVVTACQMYSSRPTPSGGFNNPNLSGDFRLLMADYAFIGLPIQYHLIGFQPGHYSIYTYSGSAQGNVVNLFVSVPGSSTPIQTVTGPMPANQFIYGLDYCVHELNITGTSFELDLSTDAQQGPNPEVHGFQIVYSPTPEPSTVFALSAALLTFAVRRRKRCRQ